MNTPTLTYSSTTVDLGYPTRGARREIEEQSASRRTLGGVLRSSVLSYCYAYRLGFSGVLTTVYDSLVALRDAAVAAGDPLLFDFADVWPTANGVAVWVEIGPLTWDVPGTDAGSFDLTLTEVDPR